MLYTVRALTWAIPVKYDDLMPALKALNSLLPIIQVILSCKKNPQGQQCYIGKMPQELLDDVIRDMIDDKLLDEQDEWRQLKMCYEGSCSRNDHISEHDIGVIVQEVAQEHEVYPDEFDPAFRKLLRDRLWDYDEKVLYEEHGKNVCAYLEHTFELHEHLSGGRCFEAILCDYEQVCYSSMQKHKWQGVLMIT
jgi:hypothetical protein